MPPYDSDECGETAKQCREHPMTSIPSEPTAAAPGANATSRADVREIGGIWWLTLIVGIIWTIYGMFVLSLRPTTIWSLAILIGISFILGGVAQIMVAARVDSWKWLFYVGAVLSIIAGIVAFAWPGMTLYVLAVFLAWYLVIGGIFSVIAAFVGPKRDWWWVAIVVGVLMFILGVWAVSTPGRELLLFINIVGIWMVFYGVGEIFQAFALRSLASELKKA